MTVVSTPIVTTYGKDDYRSGEAWLLIERADEPHDGTSTLVIVLHGASGLSYSATYDHVAYDPPRLDGYMVLATDAGGPFTWCHDMAVAPVTGAIDQAITWAQKTVAQGGLGAAPGKVILIGGSMGGGNALNYAVRNKARVAGVVATIPMVSIKSVHDNTGVQYGYNTSIDNTYGGLANYQAEASNREAIEFAPQMSDIPVQIWAGTIDPIILLSKVQEFVAAHGNTELHEMVGISHDQAPLDPYVMLDFMRNVRPAIN